MTAFFGVGGNPFATPVGQKIEQATDGSLASENWALNMEICDIINETEEGPKDAIKAIRKRLQQSAGKNYTIVMYTLTVLETCVKNCGKKFHTLVCNKEFILELVKLIGPKNEPPTAVQEKVLSLIQSWADAFYQHSDMAGVVQVYQDLKVKGIEFPMTDLDAMAPIHTPQKSVKESTVTDSPVYRGNSEGRSSPGVVPPTAAIPASAAAAAAAAAVSLTPEQMAKLKRELDIVQINITVFGDMLHELTPGSEHPSDWQLLQDLNSTCKEMQERLVELVSRLSNDEVTAELLRINDLLNNLFLRYGRYEKNREAGLGAQRGDGEALRSNKGAASLIDLSDEAVPAQQLENQMAGLGIGGQLANLNTVSAQSGAISPQKSEKDDSEFDMFAQSRNLTYEASKIGGSTYESNRKPDQVSGSLAAVAEARAQGNQNAAAASQQESILMMHKESDFDEMAAWLGDSQAGTEEPLTSSEFERFLAERAAAAEALPPATSAAAAANNNQPQPSPRKSKEADPSSMFTL